MNRRHFLNAALRSTAGLTAAAALGHLPRGALSRAQATCAPRTEDNIEGPFFRAGAPARTDLVVPDEAGVRVVLGGRVLDSSCRPIPGAVIEVWHADDAGDYDLAGFAHRGVLRCDAAGRYQLHTIVPGHYRVGSGFRPAHIHLEVHGRGHQSLTTQLYFPGDPHNERDPFIRSSLILDDLVSAEGALRGHFDITL
ncbi:MAG: intradiol ring-cleavage dioxygenase [Sandaracinaceae bacterium]|nr:intradiol ring-cleavage dioxygenase [Sandaracinaceae bacterium]